MNITLYSKPDCTHCVMAKKLLADRHLTYDEVVLDVGQEQLPGTTYLALDKFKANFPDVRTVPQIIIDGVRVGGYSELSRYLVHH